MSSSFGPGNFIKTFIAVIALMNNATGGTSSPLEATGTVRNLTVNFVDSNAISHGMNDGTENKELGPLKLNVSWLPPSEGRSPKTYSISITTLSPNGTSTEPCPDESLYYTTRNGSQLQAQLPENQYLSDVPELTIRLGCIYRVQVHANPRTNPNLEPAIVDYAMPKCIAAQCSCSDADMLLPQPVVVAQRLKEDKVLIEWNSTVQEEDVESYSISFGLPILISTGGRPVYNMTTIASVPSANNSFLWALSPKENGLKNGGVVYVAVADSNGCLGPLGSYAISPAKTNILESRKLQWLILAGIVGVSFLAVGALGLIWTRDRKKYRILQMKEPEKSGKIEATTSRRRPHWARGILLNRNALYVEQEIEEAILRGEADRFEMSYARLHLEKELGKGQFGKVFLASMDRLDRAKVAVKMCSSLEQHEDVGARAQLLEEIAMMKAAGPHPHLVQLIGCCTLPGNPVCAIMEFLEGGDLLAYLHRIREQLMNSAMVREACARQSPRTSLAETLYTTLNSEPPPTPTSPTMSTQSNDSALEDHHSYANDLAASSTRTAQSQNGLVIDEFLRFAIDIAKGMQHLEAVGITHRDLAARNILLDSNCNLKISDFGLSRHGVYVIGGCKGGVRRLPVRWMSPEALRERAFTSKSDVWSFAVVLWEIGTLGAFPYPNVRDDELLRHVLSNKGRLPRPESVSPELYTIMEDCWASQAQERPSFLQLVVRLQRLSGTQYFSDGRNNPCYSALLPTKAELLDDC